MKIEINRIMCKRCNTIIESKDENAHPVWCKCQQVGVAGGLKKLRRYSPNWDDYKELSKFSYDNPDYVELM